MWIDETGLVRLQWSQSRIGLRKVVRMTQEIFALACAQINSKVGDFAGNRRLIVNAARHAKELGASCMVTPQCVLTGYPTLDLFKRDGVGEKALQELKALAAELQAQDLPPVLVGTILSDEGRCVNALCLVRDGKITVASTKRHLTRAGFFDETRVITPQGLAPIVQLGERRALCLIGQDAMSVTRQQAQNVDVVIISDAHPYWEGMPTRREVQYAAMAKRLGKPLLFVNAVGGNDAVLFDGSSCGFNAEGETVTRLPSFQEQVALFMPETQGALTPKATDATGELYAALTMATHDYVVKNGFSSVLLGLSGGVDSALVATIARDAIGARNVHCLMMPTRFTADESLTDAKALAERQQLHYAVKPIEGIFKTLMSELEDDFNGRPWDATEENLQARIRGMLLMAHSNKFGHLVLTTGNKSEAAVGYSTLYGDSVGAYAPICDVLKTKVWELCRWRNAQEDGDVIPTNIIERAPSAELREGQTDQQSLPDYAILDDIVHRYVHQGQSVETLTAESTDPAVVRRIVTLIHRNEYKRRQSPLGPKVTPVSFCVDWKNPMTAGYSL